MCWLEFNPARLLRGSNAQAVDGTELDAMLRQANAEMRQRTNGTSHFASELPGPNTMRIEWRLLDTHAVRYHLKTHLLSQFMPRFWMLSGKMDEFLSKSIFQEPPPLCTHLAELSARALPVDEWPALFESVGADKKHVKQLLAIYAYDRMIDQTGWKAADGLPRTTFAEAASSLTSLRRDLRCWRLLYLHSPDGISYAQLYVELHRAAFARWGHDDDVVGEALPVVRLQEVGSRRSWAWEHAHSGCLMDNPSARSCLQQ